MMQKRRPFYLSFNVLSCLVSGVFFLCTALQAQTDAHYWTHQYGAKGLLLNGAVIAGPEDETAVYYNPGAMGNGEDFGVSLSFFTPSYSVLTTRNYLGRGNEFRDTGFRFTPGFGAVGFKPFKKIKLRAAFTSFTRFRSGLRYRDRVVGQVQNQAGKLFIGNLEFRRNVSTRWFGYGMAYRLNDNLSIGATQFASFHSESALLEIQKEIVSENNPTVLEQGWRSKFNYGLSVRGGLLTKFGISATIGKVKLGLTATTPTFHHFMDDAQYEFDDLKIFSADSVSLNSNRKSAALQNYKTPWSIGLGVDFQIQRSRISFSTEYFFEQKTYTVIDDVDDPFEGLAAEEFANRTLIDAGEREVLNAAIGWQFQRNEKMTLIIGFRTDFNQRKLDQDLASLSFLSTTPNIFHVSAGGFLTLWNNKFSLGLDYAFGSKSSNSRAVDLSNITSENLFSIDGSEAVNSRFRSLIFIFTYDFIVKSWKNRKQIIRERREKEREKLKKEGYIID